jgi:hypothetical protein
MYGRTWKCPSLETNYSAMWQDTSICYRVTGGGHVGRPCHFLCAKSHAPFTHWLHLSNRLREATLAYIDSLFETLWNLKENQGTTHFLQNKHCINMRDTYRNTPTSWVHSLMDFYKVVMPMYPQHSSRNNITRTPESVPNTVPTGIIMMWSLTLSISFAYFWTFWDNMACKFLFPVSFIQYSPWIQPKTTELYLIYRCRYSLILIGISEKQRPKAWVFIKRSLTDKPN